MDTHQSNVDVLTTLPSRTAGHGQAVAAGSSGPAAVSKALLVPTILSGGSGSRLWPMSREALPKQFLPLLSSRTMLQETALRATGQLPDGTAFGAPIVVSSREHRFLIANQLRDAGIRPSCMILEPLARNSAPAVAAAALLAAEQDRDAVLWIMPADAMIDDIEALHVALTTALPLARAGRIVTFGVRPTAPETGYGYIETGAPIGDGPAAFEVARFMEKPDLATARVLAASGSHLWNSGMFVASAATLVAEFEAHAPELMAHVIEAVELGDRDAGGIRLYEAAFARCPSISLDYAIAEKTDRAAVVSVAFGWSDIGSWAALWDNSDKDLRGNAALGDVMFEESDRCLVRTDGVLTAVIGLQDAVLVVTDDAVLAVHRDRAQQVKQLVERLRGAGRPEAVAQPRVHRPWGHYESVLLEARFQVKRIVVEPGEKLSLQKHYHRSEHWVVVQGSASVTRDHEQLLVGENESIYLPLGCIHRLENKGRIPLVLIEVQIGSYLGEDDIVRIEDQYGR